MVIMIKDIRDSINHENGRLNKALLIIGYFFFFGFCLSILLFSNNSSLNKIYYGFFALFAIVVIIQSIRKRNFYLKIEDIGLALFLLCVVIAKVVNKGSKFSITPFSVVAIYIVCSRFFNRDNIKANMSILNIAFLCFAAVFIVYYRNQILHFNLSVRIGSYFQNENTVGYFFVYGLSFIFYECFKKKFHLLWLLAGVVYILLIILSGSRSALIISLVMSMCFLLLICGKKYLWLSASLVLLLIIGILLVVSLPIFNDLMKRIAQSISGQDASTNERLQLAQEGFYMFLSKPLSGWGYNGMTSSSTNHLFAHNNIVGLLSDFGLFGFLGFMVAFIFPIVIRIKNYKYCPKNVNNALLLGALAIFIVQFFYVNYQLKFEYVFIALFSVASPIKMISKGANCSDAMKCYMRI